MSRRAQGAQSGNTQLQDAAPAPLPTDALAPIYPPAQAEPGPAAQDDSAQTLIEVVAALLQVPHTVTTLAELPQDILDIINMTIKPHDLYHAVFTSNRSGRDWVLRTAPGFKLSIDASKAKPGSAAWLHQMNGIRSAMITRGDLPMYVTVELGTSAASEAAAAQLHDVLRGATDNVRHIEITLTACAAAPKGHKLITSFMTKAWTTFPNLRSVTLPDQSCLPDPAKVTNVCVKELSVVNACGNNLPLFLPTLTTLNVYYPGTIENWAGNKRYKPSYTLTHVKSEGSLVSSGLAVLATYAPALKELHVGELHYTDRCRNMPRTWVLEKLFIKRGVISSDCLNCLPLHMSWDKQGELRQLKIHGSDQRVVITYDHLKVSTYDSHECVHDG